MENKNLKSLFLEGKKRKLMDSWVSHLLQI